MSEFVTYRHSFNAGDALTILPGMKKIYHETGKKAIIFQRLNLPANYGHNDRHPVLSDEGRMVCMNEKIFNMLKPLIEAQEYVESFEIWKGEKVDVDYDLTRHSSQMPLPGGDIYKWPSLIFPQLEADLTEPWITGFVDYETADISDIIVINRTERYQNPYIDYYFLKPYESKIIFAGTVEETNIFCIKWELNIANLYVKNFLHLANTIKACRFFIGNQSFCWHLAESMKVPRILEVCATYPNTFPTGKNGYSFINQGSLEYYFNKLLNETSKQDEKIG